jgi:hypothetical protein
LVRQNTRRRKAVERNTGRRRGDKVGLLFFSPSLGHASQDGSEGTPERNSPPEQDHFS